MRLLFGKTSLEVTDLPAGPDVSFGVIIWIGETIKKPLPGVVAGNVAGLNYSEMVHREDSLRQHYLHQVRRVSSERSQQYNAPLSVAAM